MMETAIGPTTLGAARAMSARLYPFQAVIDGRTRSFDETEFSLQVYENTRFSLLVPEKRASGYRWDIEMDEATQAVLRRLDDEFSSPWRRLDIVGTRTITFKVEPGAFTPLRFRLALRRGWQSGIPAAMEREITVYVLRPDQLP